LDDLIETDGSGRGVINILAADKLIGAPKVYAALLLWLLSELYERLPEVGDLSKPKFVSPGSIFAAVQGRGMR
jgi:DNA helicase HerA-like ATPase